MEVEEDLRFPRMQFHARPLPDSRIKQPLHTLVEEQCVPGEKTSDRRVNAFRDIVLGKLDSSFPTTSPTELLPLLTGKVTQKQSWGNHAKFSLRLQIAKQAMSRVKPSPMGPGDSEPSVQRNRGRVTAPRERAAHAAHCSSARSAMNAVRTGERELVDTRPPKRQPAVAREDRVRPQRGFAVSAARSRGRPAGPRGPGASLLVLLQDGRGMRAV